MAENEQKLSDRQHKAVHRKRQIKEVKTKLGNLSPAAAAQVVNEVVSAQAHKQASGFTSFIREQGVVGVGVGLVLGIQIKAVVDTVMASFVNPITAMLPGGTTLSSRSVLFTIGDRSARLGWGAIVYSLFTFLIVAFIIYAAYKLLRLDKLKKDK
ncbi:MAG TPA: MscL family protein [Candidatus Pristimantibacillus sp.]|jgi:large conductance mechanosensitive channel|nr:MscL family protein [Candidatus Pristimantibacillus sp.]